MTKHYKRDWEHKHEWRTIRALQNGQVLVECSIGQCNEIKLLPSETLAS